jgi:uncharacterized membrane-anchored protein
MRKWIYAGFGLLIIALLNFGVVQNEKLIAEGDEVFLALRPVDPRSLMQGDYMRLALEVELNLRDALKGERVRSGFAVVAPDQENVARFVRLYENSELAPNEYVVHFTSMSRQPQLVPNSFLFQEGHRQKFEEARFAVYRFSADRKSYILRGLADENKQLIEPRETLGL